MSSYTSKDQGKFVTIALWIILLLKTQHYPQNKQSIAIYHHHHHHQLYFQTQGPLERKKNINLHKPTQNYIQNI